MLANIGMLMVIAVVLVAIVKVKGESIERWFLDDSEGWKEALFNFWSGFVARPIRVIVLIVVLVMHSSIIGMVVTAAILLGISFYLAKNCSLKFDWNNEKVQKMTTTISLLVALYCILDLFGLSGVMTMVVEILGVAIAIIVVIYLIGHVKK